MIVGSVEIYNFRKLHKAKLDLSNQKTLLVGANDSGKTSAMTALRYFLKDRDGITAKDVTAWGIPQFLSEGLRLQRMTVLRIVPSLAARCAAVCVRRLPRWIRTMNPRSGLSVRKTKNI